MTEWCANCHGMFVNDSHRHPAGNGQNLDGQASNYNSYKKTGDFTGTQADSYLALVPFERGITDRTQLMPTSKQGPDNNSNVACVTCHRSHASAFRNATRWDNTASLLVEEIHPTMAELPIMKDATTPYYGRDMLVQFGEFQRNLCNKCHVQD